MTADTDVTLALGVAIAAALGAAAADVGTVYVYGHGAEVQPDGTIIERPAEILLPCVLISCKSTPLASSFYFSRSEIQLEVESQIDDDGPLKHAARVKIVAAVMQDLEALAAAYTARSLELIGAPKPTATAPEVEQRADKSVLTFRAGVRSGAS